MKDKKNAPNAPIGVIDSGVGGLSVLKVLHEILPREDFLYVGDTGRAPYGVRPEAEIRQFVGEMLDYLAQQHVKLVVIACNTLTMLGVDSLQKNYAFPIIGMSKGVKLLLEQSSNKKIAILATPFTIGTRTHEQALHAADAQVEVHPMPCPDFVTLIEAGAFGSVELQQAIARYVTPLRDAQVDTALLACTHFPFVKKQLQQAFGSGVAIVDPAEATALDAKRCLEERGLANANGAGRLQICATSAIARMQKIAGYMIADAKSSFTEINLK